MTDSPSNRAGPDNQSDTTSLVKEQVKQGTQQAQQAAGQVTDQVQQRATSMLDNQKQQATETLGSVSHALRQTGDSLQDQNQGIASKVMESAADRIDGVAAYLRERDANQLVGEFENFARGNSVVFLGGAFVLGAIAARFLKSSSPSTGSYGNSGSGDYPSSYNRPGNSGYTRGNTQWNTQSSTGGTYDFSNVSHPTDTVGATPDVQRGYAPGLMGQGKGQGEQTRYKGGARNAVPNTE